MQHRFRTSIFALSIALAACGQSATPASTASTTAAAPDTTAASATAPAMQIGACVDTTVQLTGPRLEGVPDSGSTIVYANGITQVEYDVTPGITNSHVGDTVHVCLVSVPTNCPPGDDRGKIYSAVNQRTHETWTAPDSEHSCGGA